jgi:hypothetical protein
MRCNAMQFHTKITPICDKFAVLFLQKKMLGEKGMVYLKNTVGMGWFVYWFEL